jgi:hypothetical protein
MQMIKPKYLILSFLIIFFALPALQAQSWHLEKDKDGIKVYTRPEPGSNFKAFKGETEVHAALDDVIAIIEDVEQFDVWDEDVKEIRVLEREPGKFLKYYVVYDLPWPLQDRDLCVEAVFSADKNNGNILLISGSIPEAVPLQDGIVRITTYWQKWILEPQEKGVVKVMVEGFADPAGDIPAWIANMAITDTPLNMLREIRKMFN